MGILLMALIFILGLSTLVKKVLVYRGCELRLDEGFSFKFLLGWIVLGLLTRLDYTQMSGCVIGFEPIFESRNILFSIISFSLIFWAFFTDNILLKKVLCLVELTYWCMKLMVLKGGYAVGFGGVPAVTIVCYDMLAMMARLYLLYQIGNFNKKTLIPLGVIAILVLIVKISFFSMPVWHFYGGMFN